MPLKDKESSMRDLKASWHIVRKNFSKIEQVCMCCDILVKGVSKYRIAFLDFFNTARGKHELSIAVERAENTCSLNG